MVNYEIVTSADRLAEICQAARQVEAVMLDTEFVRTRTLYPRLGLVQLFDGQTLALIDPIDIEDLSPLWALLTDEKVMKVLHSCSEDLEVFLHHGGVLPASVVDTQILAAFLGHGVSTGFAALVDQYLGVTLDKGESRTDWCARPLTDSQLKYAAADVHYLAPLYVALKEKVQQAGWWDAALEESRNMVDKKRKKPEPEKAYLDVKNAWQLRPRQLAVLKSLAAWRLKEAQKRDLALNFVVKDLNLWKMARFNIQTKRQMQEQGFDRKEIDIHGNTLIKLTAAAIKSDEADLPEKIDRIVDLPGYKSLMAVLKEKVSVVAEDTGLPPELLGSKKMLNRVIRWHFDNPEEADKLPLMMEGWRAPLLSAKLKAALAA